MGRASWSATDWSTYSKTTSSKPANAIFTSRSLSPEMDPHNQLIRESRDSKEHPESNAIIIAVDVTGSMGIIAENLVKTGLGVLFNEILDRKPVKDPQIMVMAVGDAVCDRSPFQIGQFESDITVAKWLETIHVEGNGGGNNSESYDLPVYYAAFHTSIDCFEKRGKKGYLFTIGDEMPREKTLREHVKKLIGVEQESDITLTELLESANKMYNVYHIIIAQGHYASGNLNKVKNRWSEYYGQHAVVLNDYNKLSELIVSLIQLNEGDDKDAIVNSWSGDTSVVIANALKDVGTNVTTISDNTNVIRF